jgi:hypothetical protein
MSMFRRRVLVLYLNLEKLGRDFEDEGIVLITVDHQINPSSPFPMTVKRTTKHQEERPR